MKLYDEIKWSGYDWYIFDIQEDRVGLVLKDVLDEERKYNENDDTLWNSSDIRTWLNEEFIDNLNKEDIISSPVTYYYHDEEYINYDYVRLLTIDEALKMPKDIRKTNNWYWLLNSNEGNYDFVFTVTSSGFVDYSRAYYAHTVRPAVFIKSEIVNQLIENKDEEDKKIEKLTSYISCGVCGTCNDLERNTLFEDLQTLGNKINELIDEINKLKENK